MSFYDRRQACFGAKRSTLYTCVAEANGLRRSIYEESRPILKPCERFSAPLFELQKTREVGMVRGMVAQASSASLQGLAERFT